MSESRRGGRNKPVPPKVKQADPQPSSEPESEGVIRVNISLPRELKARMDGVEVSVNWSRVAAEAFEAKLKELASTKETKNMDDVIARLKAADELDGQEDCQEGLKAGEEWAKQEARPKDLRRLDRFAESEPSLGLPGMLQVFDNGMNDGIACGLYEVLNPGEDAGDSEVESFWEQVLDKGGRNRMDEVRFALHFVLGALKVWEKVKDKV